MKLELSEIKPQIKELIRTALYRVVAPPRVPPSYSQAGEDAVLRFLFSDRGMKRISYLDVGTNRPIIGNNTYLFYKQGSRGVCVEADKTLIPDIVKARPEDKILNVGVAGDGDAKEAEFFIFNLGGINTFDKEAAERVIALGTYQIIETVKVPLVDINTLIAQNFDRYPDLLSIDIEGWDLRVLKSIDYERYPLPVLCVETCFYSESHIRPKNNAVAEFMSGKGYEVYADTYINTIFVNTKWFHQV